MAAARKLLPGLWKVNPGIIQMFQVRIFRAAVSARGDGAG